MCCRETSSRSQGLLPSCRWTMCTGLHACLLSLAAVSERCQCTCRIPFILYNSCMVIPLWRRSLHWVILLVYGFVVINGGAAAIRGIVIDTSIYSCAC